MKTIQILHDSRSIATISDEHAEIVGSPDGNIKLNFRHNREIQIDLWDIIEVDGNKHYLRHWPEINKLDSSTYFYSMDLTTTPNKKGILNH